MKTLNAGWRAAAVSMAAGLLLAPLSAEPIATAVAFFSLAVIVLLLWTPDEPPILLLPALMQWSQVALVPVATIWQGTSMLEASGFGGQTSAAAFYGLAGVTLLCLGLRLGSRTASRDRFFLRSLREETHRWPATAVVRLALGAIALGYIAASAETFGSGLRELFNHARHLKLAGIFLLAFWCLLTRQKYGLLTAIVLVDVLLGMTGFFADFMGTVMAVAIAAIAARSDFTRKDVVVLVVTALLVILPATFWSAIKPEYRDFANQGSGDQVAVAPLMDRLEYVGGKLASFDGEQFEIGLDALVKRHGYTEFLGLTMDYVPEVVPHEYGGLTLAMLQHVAMPRLLFPWKPPLPSDTDVMVQYTGLPHTWTTTSISIGYLGELYVDFGLFGLLAAAALGAAIGRLYAMVRDHTGTPRLLNVCLCILLMMSVSNFGTAYAKVIGALIYATVIALLVQRVALKRILSPALIKMRQPVLPRQRV